MLFCIFLAAPGSANASVLDCINALTGLKTAVQLASEVADPEFLSCTQQMATGDVALIATVALIVGSGTAGAFPDEATCNNMVTGPIGQFVAFILTNSGPVSDFLKSVLGQGGYNELVKFASNEAGSNIAQIEALQPVFRYLTCGCKVYGKAKAVAAAAKGWLGDVKECAGFFADVGGAFLDIVESGADAVGELFGHPRDGPVGTQTDNFPECGNWQFFPENTVFSQQGIASNASSTTKTGYHVENISCQCYAPARMETKPAFDGKIAVHCACDSPKNSVYSKETKVCGCPLDTKLENGACVACDTPHFTESAAGTSVAFGSVHAGKCEPKSQICKPGTKPVLAKAGYYYECLPACETGQTFVLAPGALPSSGTCQSCPVNYVADKAALTKGAFQCSECPRGTARAPGSNQCNALVCENGIDLNNQHACRSPCELVGEGKNKRLVCKGGGGATQSNPDCLPGMTRQNGVCAPVIYHKPDVIYQEGMDYLRTSPEKLKPTLKNQQQRKVQRAKPVTPDKRARPARQKDTKRGGSGASVGVENKRNNGSVLLGPVEDRSTGPAIGDIIDFGMGLGQTLDLGSRRRSQPAEVDTPTVTEPAPSRRRKIIPVTPDVQRNQKD